jgi:hypothetical protein
MASTPNGAGYWLVASDGGVFSFGDARFHGSLADQHLRARVVGMASTPNGAGYWLVASDGNVYSFGDAQFHGSMVGKHLRAHVVGMVATPNGAGYWLVAADGGVFSFGDARFHGSLADQHLRARVVGMASTPSGAGYWLASSDGGVSSFGDARPAGSLHDRAGTVTGISANGSGGYWLIPTSGTPTEFFEPSSSSQGLSATKGQPELGRTSRNGESPQPVGRTTTSSTVRTTTSSTVRTTTSSTVRTSTSSTVRTTTSSTVRTTTSSTPTTAPSTVATTTSSTPTTTPSTVATTTSSTVPTTTSSTIFGVLLADPDYLSADTAAGLRLAMINIGWDEWEPEQGSFDDAYISQQAATVAEYLSAGWTVAVDVGLQSPPSWALGLPYGQLVDQDGNSSGTPDYEFSEAVRAAATTYISSVVSSLTGVSYYRIGLSTSGEMLYPPVSDNQWWAFSPLAQGSASGLPAGVGVAPMPGWVPGSTTWDGEAVTQAMVQSWYDWYLGALINAHTWEIDSFRQAGYQGLLQYVMPGVGAVPSLYQQSIAGELAPNPDDPYNTMNTGAVWWDVLPQLPLTGAVVDISSVGDGSGDPVNNVCQASDSSVDYTSQPSVIESWSATRWLTYLAGLNHLPVMGENPGNITPAELPAIMSQVQACHLTALQWAWDYTLNESGPYVSLSDYAQAIAASP